jgi:hypothetical protein
MSKEILNLELLRYSDANKCTQGLLFLNGKFFTHTLEDEFKAVKVKGETRIPEGTYKLGLQLQNTPLTLRYRERYPSFFKHHIEILNIPNYSGVYIHPGNDHTHTDGCLLVGGTINNNTVEGGKLSQSGRDFEALYKILYPHLLAKKEAQIWIHSYYKM